MNKNMVKLEIMRDNLKGILIDGYVPTVKELRGINWKELQKQGKIPKNKSYWDLYLPKLLHSENLTEKQLLKTFGRLVHGIRASFCQFEQKPWSIQSTYIPYTTKKNHYSLETFISKQQRRILGKYLPSLSAEYRNDEKKGKERYIQNVVICNANPQTSCYRVQECCENWVKILGLKIKERTDYHEYEGFRRTWFEILDYHFNLAEQYEWFGGAYKNAQNSSSL